MVQFTPPPRKSTGIGKIVSLINFILLFTLLPFTLKMIWPSLLALNIPQPFFYIIIVFSTNIAVLGLYNLVMMYIYTAKIPFFQKYRNSNVSIHLSQKPWPWQTDNKKWHETLKKTIKTVLFNLFVLTSLLPLFEYFTGGMLYKKELDQFPSILTSILQFLLFMFVQDLAFYYVHSTLHSSKLYWIHKKHHQYTITSTIAATYAHPIQYIFGNAIPTGLGYHLLVKFVPVHYSTMISWYIFRLLQTCQGHCGYDWSWSQMSFIKWKLGSDYHDFHHSHNVGNFGSMFGFWDAFWKTDLEYRKFKIKSN